VAFVAKKRNTVLDRMFYDIGALIDKEIHHLAGANADAAIIAVYPQGNKGDISLQRYENLVKF
jgi:hypothetical protein